MLYDSFIDIFGKYEPIVVSGSSITGDPNLQVADFSYIFMMVLVCIVFLSFFRILGGVLHHGKHD